MSRVLIRPEQYRQMPWKNGGGITYEIAIAPPGCALGEPFTWRLSLAQVDRPGPFSTFAGYERIITLIEGAGMCLDFGEQGRALLDQSLRPFTFQGEWPVTCTLSGGPVTDLNLMLDRQLLTAQAQVVPAAGQPLPLRADTAILFSPHDEVVVTAPDAADVVLPARGTLILQDPPMSVLLRGDPAADPEAPRVCLFTLCARAQR